MREKERFDAFMRLADLRLTRWNARRDTEWKISLGFWGFLALVATNRASVKISTLYLWIALVFVIAIYCYFIWQIAWRNEDDQRAAFEYSRRAEQVVTGWLVQGGPMRSWWAYWLQIAATVVIVLYTGWSIPTSTPEGQRRQIAPTAMILTFKNGLDIVGLAIATISALFLWRASEETPQSIRSFSGGTATEAAFRGRRTLQARIGFSLLFVGFALQLVSRFL